MKIKIKTRQFFNIVSFFLQAYEISESCSDILSSFRFRGLQYTLRMLSVCLTFQDSGLPIWKNLTLIWLRRVKLFLVIFIGLQYREYCFKFINERI